MNEQMDGFYGRKTQILTNNLTSHHRAQKLKQFYLEFQGQQKLWSECMAQTEQTCEMMQSKLADLGTEKIPKPKESDEEPQPSTSKGKNGSGNNSCYAWQRRILIS